MRVIAMLSTEVRRRRVSALLVSNILAVAFDSQYITSYLYSIYIVTPGPSGTVVELEERRPNVKEQEQCRGASIQPFSLTTKQKNHAFKLTDVFS